MKVIVQFECDSLLDAKRVLNFVDRGEGENAPRVVSVSTPPLPGTVRAGLEEKPKAKRGRPRKTQELKTAEAARADQAPTAKPAVDEATEAAQSAPDPQPSSSTAPTIEDARKVLQALNAKKGMAVCQQVMRDLKMPRVSELKPEQITPFIAAVQAEIEKA